ncbi:calmodulin binding PICBP-like [Olea europaea subsp. europaea]|uniref:Calmodulin binding PICBP-like n=1 Tax=Olea europaea subsp. europaea TaxID=158383 RepID=A0A8S0S6X4_OLEEU|nr:calmodulin binding PICBP-like [Olea europaea subsp. europaea]
MDSSPDCKRATSNFDEKKENSPAGSECDENVSLSSSTQGSAFNGLPGPYRDMGIKNRTNKKKTLKNFRNLKTFRRRARSRAVDQISKDMSDDLVTPQQKSSLEVSDETPRYMKATTSSKGKKANSMESQQNSEFCFDNTDQTSSHSSQSNVASPSVGSLQTSLTALNLRNVKILIKTTSFKPKRSSLKYSRVSQDLIVDRATFSSTLKDSKFAKQVEHIPEEVESEKTSVMKVCRYHHCSLHGHCNEAHDPVPPQKRLLYKKRRSLKKQKSTKPKSDSMSVTKSSRDKKKDLQKGQMISNLQQLVQGESDSIATSYEGDTSSSCALEVKMSETPWLSASYVMDSGTEIKTTPKTQLVGDGYSSIQESDLVEIAFGETSNPEENYRESLNRVMDYGTQKQGILCSKCSSIKMEPNESKGTADVDLPRPQVLDSNLGNGYKATDFSDTAASSISLKADEQFSADNKGTATSNGAECDFNEPNIQNALTPDHFDEVTESNSVMFSTSDDQTSKYGNPESERKFTAEVMHAEDSESSEVVHVKNSEVSTRFHEENKTQFNKFRHISMWHMIHQHMAESMAAESENKPLQDDDGSNVLRAKESSASSRNFSDSDRGILNNNYELDDIEVRKLFAVKLVREAIEKILLPEVQDQTSDDQSMTSDTAHEQELFEKNEHKGSVQESSTECEPDKAEGDVPADLKEVGLNNNDISGQEMVQTDKEFGSKSEKKAPKHWSNLKKWILLQRFIKELEKVRKFNPTSPQHLPLKPDPESEKVNLRPQTVEERKKAEEWMLDYALRQAVSQLAPTQKRKVSVLIKAFETVVTPNEDNSQKFAGITHEVGESVLKENSPNKEAQDIFELKSNNGETALEHNLQGIQKDTVVCLNSEFPTGNFLPTIGNIETRDPDYGSGESKNLILDGNGLSTEDTISSAVHCGTLELETKVRGEANQEVMPELRGFQEDTVSDKKESETKNGSHNIQLERQNHIRMWHSIYQHVVSGIAEKVGSQFLDGTDDDEVEDCNELPKISKGDFFLKSDDDSVKENRVSSHLNSAFTKSDAAKLVQEALDEILLPEIQDDSSDTQSVTSDFNPDQEFSESLNQENETQCTREGGISVDQQDWKMKSARRPEPLKSKNWSKLKKLILLKRSLKALEKARKLNLQPPQQLSVMPDPKQEKADLRHQMMDERKKAEQWMLDYAVQHIVTKLTPARKRRVSMLVEAFEAVVPLPEPLTP